MTKISVIIPVYNVENYLKRAVDSVLNQSYKNLEIILIDDGSTDNSPQICDGYKKDERVKVVHKENGGVSSARNLGLELATGEYVAFVDPDDIVDNKMYEKLVHALETENADISMCGINQLFEDGSVVPLVETNFTSINSKNVFSLFLKDGYTLNTKVKYIEKIMGCVWRTLYKKEILEGIRFESLAIAEDLVFNIDVFSKNIKVALVNERLYFYFQRLNSVMNSFNESRVEKQKAGFLTVLDRVKDKVTLNEYLSYQFFVYAYIMNLVIKSKQKKLLKQLLKDKEFCLLNNKETYRAKKKLTPSFKRKIAFFLVHKKWFWIYSLLLKFV